MRGRRAAMVLTWAALFGFAYARFATFHNRTFDLAFYSRMAWGLGRFEFWDPFLDAHVLGLHVSPVLLPLGWLGQLLGTPVVLLAAQAAAVVGAGALLGRVGERHLGPVGWAMGFAGLLAHPNISHVLTYEAHPGTLAILPLACAAERIDAGDRRGFVLGCVGVLACREDLAVVVMLLALVAATRKAWRPLAAKVAVASFGYLLLFVLVLHPAFAPSTGSFELHFGPWGDSLGAAMVRWITDPGAVLEHISAPRRLTYLPRILAPLALLPLLGPRWLLPALPIVAMNLLSHFPTTPNLDSHYLTPALPFFVMAAIMGIARFQDRRLPMMAVAMMLGITLGALGIDPGAAAYRRDDRSEASERIVEAIEARGARSLQAPDPLLPHVSERLEVHRLPPPDRNADLVVLDLQHRQRYAHRETLLRTSQEPLVRTWLGRSEYGVVLHAPPWILLERGADARALLEQAPLRGDAQRLCACLSIQSARISGDSAVIELRAHGSCPNDLAIRVGDAPHPRRVDLLFEGAVSPAHLREGDVVISRHEGLDVDTLFVGALRSSGARPHPNDPIAVQVSLSDPSAESSTP